MELYHWRISHRFIVVKLVSALALVITVAVELLCISLVGRLFKIKPIPVKFFSLNVFAVSYFSIILRWNLQPKIHRNTKWTDGRSGSVIWASWGREGNALHASLFSSYVKIMEPYMFRHLKHCLTPPPYPPRISWKYAPGYKPSQRHRRFLGFVPGSKIAVRWNKYYNNSEN